MQAGTMASGIQAGSQKANLQENRHDANQTQVVHRQIFRAKWTDLLLWKTSREHGTGRFGKLQTGAASCCVHVAAFSQIPSTQCCCRKLNMAALLQQRMLRTSQHQLPPVPADNSYQVQTAAS